MTPPFLDTTHIYQIPYKVLGNQGERSEQSLGSM